ncbi:hypothetical protein TcBrA4_0041170 [Trypanosoma cruzi]|nr:hypothetical protein TcBrA4_0041170 [Trypanosoma cruzi]
MWRRRWCLTNRCGAWHTCRTARNVRKSFFHSHAARRRNGGTCASERSEVQPDGIRQGAGCHFHDARNKTGHSQVVPTSMCVHHVREDDYAALMARFGNDTSPVARVERYSET